MLENSGIVGKIKLEKQMRYKIKPIMLAVFLLISIKSFSQWYYIGKTFDPGTGKFELIAVSEESGILAYKYIGPQINEKMFNRKIGDIVMGVKSGIITIVFYNLIPEKGDIGVPESTLELVQRDLPYPLINTNGNYEVSINHATIQLFRANNPITFKKDRIIFLTKLTPVYKSKTPTRI
jgi:hypothetical protein